MTAGQSTSLSTSVRRAVKRLQTVFKGQQATQPGPWPTALLGAVITPPLVAPQPAQCAPAKQLDRQPTPPATSLAEPRAASADLPAAPTPSGRAAPAEGALRVASAAPSFSQDLPGRAVPTSPSQALPTRPTSPAAAQGTTATPSQPQATILLAPAQAGSGPRSAAGQAAAGAASLPFAADGSKLAPSASGSASGAGSGSASGAGSGPGSAASASRLADDSAPAEPQLLMPSGTGSPDSVQAPLQCASPSLTPRVTSRRPPAEGQARNMGVASASPGAPALAERRSPSAVTDASTSSWETASTSDLAAPAAASPRQAHQHPGLPALQKCHSPPDLPAQPLLPLATVTLAPQLLGAGVLCDESNYQQQAGHNSPLLPQALAVAGKETVSAAPSPAAPPATELQSPPCPASLEVAVPPSAEGSPAVQPACSEALPPLGPQPSSAASSPRVGSKAALASWPLTIDADMRLSNDFEQSPEPPVHLAPADASLPAKASAARRLDLDAAASFDPSPPALMPESAAPAGPANGWLHSGALPSGTPPLPNRQLVIRTSAGGARARGAPAPPPPARELSWGAAAQLVRSGFAGSSGGSGPLTAASSAAPSTAGSGPATPLSSLLAGAESPTTVLAAATVADAASGVAGANRSRSGTMPPTPVAPAPTPATGLTPAGSHAGSPYARAASPADFGLATAAGLTVAAGTTPNGLAEALSAAMRWGLPLTSAPSSAVSTPVARQLTGGGGGGGAPLAGSAPVSVPASPWRATGERPQAVAWQGGPDEVARMSSQLQELLNLSDSASALHILQACLDADAAGEGTPGSGELTARDAS